MVEVNSISLKSPSSGPVSSGSAVTLSHRAVGEADHDDCRVGPSCFWEGRVRELAIRQSPEGDALPRAARQHITWFYVILGALCIVLYDLILNLSGGLPSRELALSLGEGFLLLLVSTPLLHRYANRSRQESEARYNALRKHIHDWGMHANDIVFLLDAEGGILEANDRAVSAYGYSQEALKKLTLRALIADEHQFDLRWQCLIEAGSFRAESVHRRADGSTFPIETSARRIDIEGGALVQVVIRDVSATKAFEQEIIHLKDAYAALSRTNRCITSATDRSELFQTTCDIAVKYGHFKLAWIGLIDAQSRQIVPTARAGDATGFLDGIEVSIAEDSPNSKGPSGRAASTGQPVLSNNLEKDHTTDPGPWLDRIQKHGIRSWASFPLFLQGKVLGVLSLQSSETAFFTPEVFNLLAEMANDISACLDRMESEAENKRLSKAFTESHAWVQGIVQSSSDLIAAVDRNMILTLINEPHREMIRDLGLKREIGLKVADGPTESTSGWQRALKGRRVTTEWSYPVGDTVRYIESHFAPLLTAEGKVVGAFHVGRDVTRRKQMELELSRQMTAIEQSPVAVIITDAQGKILYVNQAFTAQSGYTAEEVHGKNPSLLKSGDTPLEEYQAMWASLLRGDSWSGVFHNVRKDGTLYWEEAVIAPVRDPDGQIVELIGLQQDVTLRREAEENARFLALHDPLTALPNRLVGRSSMERAIQEADATRTKAALIFLDVDHFKRVNDSLGHRAGDNLLKALVERLKNCIRERDVLSRLGGDEFLIVLSQIESSDSVERFAERIREQTAKPFQVDGFELSVTVSMGIAVYPDHGATFDELHRRADLAMYCAKKSGRNAHQVYTKAMETDAHEYLLILNGIRKGLDDREFVLHYQPQIDLHNGEVVGAEALIRWNHPKLGLIPPGRFIAVAEDSGLIAEMGNWVIQEACRQAARWQGAGHAGVPVAVNLSALQFRRGHLAEVVAEAINNAGLEPEMLELELTESVLVEDRINVASTLSMLQAFGVRVALDDFGTGYSTFTYLRDFRFDKLKIDQTFVRNICNSKVDESIVRSITQLSQNFGIKTIAEGVESQDAVEILRRASCDQAQGYLFGKPMGSEDFVRFLEARTPDGAIPGFIPATRPRIHVL